MHSKTNACRSFAACALLGCLESITTGLAAQEAPANGWPVLGNFEAHGQATYVAQRKPAFAAAYSGPNSLSPLREHSYSFTSTLFLGWQPTPGLEVFINPEVVQGLPMSRLVGLGGLTNSELQKTAGTNPVIYRARAFVRKTWGLGGETESVESDINQFAGTRDTRRVVLTAGNFAMSDIFDANSYAHDGRSRFLNWALLGQGAFDFAADSRGYTWGVALEYIAADWAVRAGRFLVPVESNGLKLDWAINRQHGDQVEFERGWQLGRQAGRARLLLYRNTEVMGSFQDALALGAATATTPDVGAVRRRQDKKGWGINLEQAINDTSGVFLRVGRHDGRTETYSFAEIDHSFSAGLVVGGGPWGRPRDTLGLAWARNGLSSSHRAYLAAGGQGFFVGDGALPHYRPESIIETYYQFGLGAGAKPASTVMLGFQRVRNPAYNADRGPVNISSARLHAEF